MTALPVGAMNFGPEELHLKHLAEDPRILSEAHPTSVAQNISAALEETRHWLHAASQFGGPAPVAQVRQWAADVEGMVRRRKLDTSVELDSAEILRRCERALGTTIRNGQAQGLIASKTNPGNRPRKSYLRNGRLVRVSSTPTKVLASPREFIPAKQNTHEAYMLSDGVTDETFDKVITAARAMENLSRANVLRLLADSNKIVEDLTRAPRWQKAERIAQLAEDGISSRQIGEMLGITDETIRSIAREFKVDIPADKIIARTRRHDSNRIVTQTIDTLGSLVLGLDLVDYDDLDPAELSQWVTSMDESFRALNRFRTQLKKATHHNDSDEL